MFNEKTPIFIEMKNIARSICIALVLTGFAANLSIFGQKVSDTRRPMLLLISLDGFRYDYLEMHKPEIISRFAAEGTRAKWLIPSFPTKTFPNHYTIVTGLYPQNHGIVENNVWDYNTVFSMSKREEVQNGRWWLGEPVWVTAALNNISTGAFFFPGTEAEINGIRPRNWRTYEHTLPYEERVDTVLKWLGEPAEARSQFYTLYFDEPDSAGHDYGPESKETGDAVKRVDAMIGRLLEGISRLGLEDELNIIITSDHGMAQVDNKKTIILDEQVDVGLAERIIWGSEIVQIFPKEGAKDDLLAGLKKVKNMTCWEKGKLPERLNYNSGPRVAPVVCSAKLGFSINNRSYFENTIKKRRDWDGSKGAHGYDNKHKEMRAFFAARGPAFKRSSIVKPFRNVDVYELMCKVLGITPAKNDGDLNRSRSVLRVSNGGF